MAKQMGVIQYSGKLGQTVGMSGQNGKNYMRVRRDTIKNPRSAGQAIQRMIASTVAVAISYLTEILNNSVEGKTNGAQTLNYLRSLWMNMLRTADAAQTPSTYLYLPKGKKIFVPNRYLLSQGRLAAPAFSVDDDAEITMNAATVVSSPDVATASDLFPDVRVGDQITIIIISSDGTLNYTEAQYCRFAFKNDTTPALIDGTASGTHVLNPEAIDLAKAAGKWQELTFGIYDEQLHINAEALSLSSVNANGQCFGAGVIVSNIENKQRSTSYFVSSGVESLEDYLCGGDVYPSYMTDSTDIDLASEIYLNNSARRNDANYAGVVSCSVDGNDVPGVLVSADTTPISLSGLPSNPSDVRLMLRKNGENLETSNIISASQSDTVVTGVTLATAWNYVSNEGSFGLLASDDGFMVLGGYAICDGVRYDF